MRPFWDPVVVAALGAGLLPILPGLPCPTCAGRSEFRDDMFGSSPCPDCADGVWTPPDSPVPIGVTSAEPGGSYGDWDVYFDDISYSLGSEDADDNLVMHPIVLSSVIGEGTLRKLKVVARTWPQNVTEMCVSVHAPEDDAYPRLVLWTPGETYGRNVSSALPFLPGLKPDDTVYLLDGFTDSIECPECHGYCCLPIRLGSDGLFGGGGQCPSCLGTGRLPCPFPVDAPDHPCVLEAT